MTSLLLHDHPEWFIKYEPFWFCQGCTAEHHHNSLILNFCSHFVDFELNFLEHCSYQVSLQVSALYLGMEQILICPIDLKLDNWHLKFVIFGEPTEKMVCASGHFRNILGSFVLVSFYEVEFLVLFFEFESDHKIRIIFVINQLNIVEMLVLCCGKPSHLDIVLAIFEMKIFSDSKRC